MLIYRPGTAQLPMNAHPGDRARQPFDLGLLPTANTIPGVSSRTLPESLVSESAVIQAQSREVTANRLRRRSLLRVADYTSFRIVASGLVLLFRSLDSLSVTPTKAITNALRASLRSTFTLLAPVCTASPRAL